MLELVVLRDSPGRAAHDAGDRRTCRDGPYTAPLRQLLFRQPAQHVGQFLINNKNMAVGGAAIKVDPATVQILKLPAMVNPDVYPKPIPFGGMGKPVNQDGFSDDFPIKIKVTEADLAAR